MEEPYEQEPFPWGGIEYLFEALGRHFEQNVSQLAPTPTQAPFQEQRQVGIENGNIDVCENHYAEFTMDDYEDVLRFAGENTKYDGYAAVAYAVLNRTIRDGKTGQFCAYKREEDSGLLYIMVRW